MKNTFMAWLGLGGSEGDDSRIDTNRAAAALMAEVMAVDHEWHELEIERIEDLMQVSLGLDAEEARQIVSEVLEQQKTRHDLFQFTSAINEKYDSEQKFELLKSLWCVAYADGRIDAYEEHIIRRLADLIRMPHGQFIKAKIEAREQ